MRFSLNLLKQFVKISINPEQLGALLTEHAFEIENVSRSGGDFQNIFAAKVLEIQKHPNADRLRVVKLDVGNKTVEPVVCGAFNFERGAMVALALPGAKIAQNIHSQTHEPFILEKATIRGIESQGMICAPFELGLSDKPEEKGIMLLDESAAPGMPLGEILGNDAILTAALPANRWDLQSHLGMAREIAAVTNQKIRNSKFEIRNFPVSKNWGVTVKDQASCPLYYAAKMSVKVGPSPKFMRDALTAVGMRPINNIVDITNYVMIELGQPTHAYDAAKVQGNLLVRKAGDKEKFSAINHKDYALDSSMFVIADEQNAIALGGLIGGLETEISPTTTEIIFEAANFNGQVARRTSKAVGLKTDGCKIWEKGVPPKLAEYGLARGIELLQKYANGKITGFVKFQKPIKAPAAIKFTADDINKLLGTDLKPIDIVKYLSRYGIITKKLSATRSTSSGQASYKLTATPPWWRTDLTTAPDLAEEVLKLYGYNKVKPEALNIFPDSKKDIGQAYTTDDIYQTKSFFARLGYSEVQNYNFVSEKDLLKFGGNPKNHVEIANPLSEDQRYLKQHPLIPLLKNINSNQKNFDQFKLFEVGKKYFGFGNEPLTLSGILFSKIQAPEMLLMEAKGDILKFLNSVGHNRVSFPPMADGSIHIEPRAKIGSLVPVGNKLLQNFDITGKVVCFSFALEPVLASKKDIIYQPINKFPKVERDVSIVIDQKISWNNIEQTIKPLSSLISQIGLFEAAFLTTDKDSQKFHETLQKQGKKNLGIRLTFEADRTLTDIEVSTVTDKISQKLSQQLGAEIR